MTIHTTSFLFSSLFFSVCICLLFFFLEKNSMIICSFKKLKFIYFTTIDKKQLIFIFFVGKDVSSRGSLVQWILDILDTIIRILDSKIIIDFENFYIRIVSYQNFEILISENGRYLFHQEMAYSILKNQNIILWYQKNDFFRLLPFSYIRKYFKNIKTAPLTCISTQSG